MSKLEELTIDEVSLVDEGANPEAHIVLFKRKEENKMEEETKTVEKNVEEKTETVEAKTESQLNEFCEKLSKRLEEHIATVERNELLKVAAKYEILGEKSDELAGILKQAKAAGLYDKIIGQLDRELAFVEKAGLFEEIGKNGHGASSAEELAKKLQAEDANLSWRWALEKAYEKLEATR